MTHLPVLLRECIDGLDIKPGGTYVDGTLGRAGHAVEIMKRLGSGTLVAIDRDEEAIKAAKSLLAGFSGSIRYIHGNFRDLSAILKSEGIDAVDGMLFDLGVSSPQIDDDKRGFSFSRDARLDMRMDGQDELTAYDLVNYRPENELRSIFYQFGEEKHSALIARAIVRRRAAKPIETTLDLCDVIISAIPASARREAQHPAKRCFQALRIAVNDELESLKDMLAAVPAVLKAQGRICVVSFHSLEDRLVKNSFAALAKGCVCPKDFPICVCGVTPTLKVITKKPITPSSEESERNPRSRSAKLRIAEKM